MTTKRFSHCAVLMAGTALLAMPSLAGAQTTNSAPQSAEDIEAQNEAEADYVVDAIIVTGTRRTQRTVFDSLAPIDVVDEDSIDITASEDLLDTLAQTIPSFNVQRLPLADGRAFVRPATLRGLSPDQTLVLVNGRRRHRSALIGGNGAQAPDLATIPSFAIERIEVLRDGASAQYGSDAIAGVINIILDDDPGFNGFGQFSEYYEGDGTTYRVGLQGGVPLGDNGFIVGTFEFFDSGLTSRSRQRPDAIAFQEANPGVEVRNPVQNWGQPEAEAIRFAWNSQYGIGDFADLYFFGTYNEGEGVSDFNWRNPETNSAFRQSDAFPDFDLRTIYPGGFTPQFGQEDSDLSLVGGLRGDFADGDFTWDVAVSHGRNTINYFIFDTINASLGPDSPTAFDPGTLEQREFNINADFVYRLNAGLYDAINIAFGAERREETYEIGQGDPASFAIGPGAADRLPTGSNGFRGFEPRIAGEFEQESYAGYIDVEIPFTEAFTLGLAGRYEDFSEFGDTLNGKVSARYEFTPNFAIRATASTGFRAPTPGQLFSERTTQGLDTETLQIFTNGRFSPQGPVADIINQRPDVDIQELRPEESENYTVGLTFRSGGFRGTVDVYQINITDRFSGSADFDLTDAERAALTDLGIGGANTFNSVEFFQNDFDTRTRGVDVVLSYTTGLGAGDLTLTGAYNYNETEVTDGNVLQNERTVVSLEDRLPNHVVNLSGNYNIGAFGFFARSRYFGPWTDRSDNAGGDLFQDFGGELFFDVAVTYNLNENVALRVGAENVFDNFPDEATFQANRGLIYSRNAPYDTDGGLYYARLDVRF